MFFILRDYNKKQVELFPFGSWGTYNTDMKWLAKVVQEFYNAATVGFWTSNIFLVLGLTLSKACAEKIDDR